MLQKLKSWHVSNGGMVMDQTPRRRGRPYQRRSHEAGKSDGATLALLPLRQTRSLEIRMRNAAGEWISAWLVARIHSGVRDANAQVQHTLIHPN